MSTKNQTAPKTILIIGTNTNVGKTWFSAFLTYHLKADYWKPIQTGSPHDSQYIQTYLQASCQIHPSTYTFAEPISPHLASKNAKQYIEIPKIQQQLKQIIESSQAEFLIIESAGGICTPLNPQHTNLDLSYSLKCPTLLISNAYLGCLNHAIASHKLLTQSLNNANTKFLGWVLNGYDEYPYNNYIQDLINYSQSPLFFQIQSKANIIHDHPNATKQLQEIINQQFNNF